MGASDRVDPRLRDADGVPGAWSIHLRCGRTDSAGGDRPGDEVARPTAGVVSRPAIDVARPWLRIQRDQSYERRVIASVFRPMWQRPDLPRAAVARAVESLRRSTRGVHRHSGDSRTARGQQLRSRPVLRRPGAIPAPARSCCRRRWPIRVLACGVSRNCRPDRRCPADGQRAADTRALRRLADDGAGAGDVAGERRRCARRGEVCGDAVVGTRHRPDRAGAGVLSRRCGFRLRHRQCADRPAGRWIVESSLLLLRAGSGIFAVGGDDADREKSMPILVRLADGTEVRDWIDGAAPSSTTLIYTAKTPSSTPRSIPR